MSVKSMTAKSVLAAGIGLSVLGVGAGVASAAPAQGAPQQVQQQPNGPTVDRHGDHHAFNYRGHRVTPRYDRNHHGWGFDFGGRWIPIR